MNRKRRLEDVSSNDVNEKASASMKLKYTPLAEGANTGKGRKKKKHPLMHLVAGGAAGFVESSVCHPLDTIKTRTQLQGGPAAIAEAVKERTPVHSVNTRRPIGGARWHATSAAAASAANLGTIGTARHIVRKEGIGALYKGLTAVYTGIVPKMAIRFLSFEQYREGLQNLTGGPPPGMPPGQFAPSVTFFAGLASGLTEAVMVVTPAEVCKIRMQSTVDPNCQLGHRKYTNVAQTAVTIVREEGLGALYIGVVPTMMRQGCNQAVNFTTYNYFKKTVIEWRKEHGQSAELLHWQSLLLGGISGGFGPMVNNPIDVVKTRMQKQVVHPDRIPKYTGMFQSCVVISKEEGYPALWKGITPRLLRIMSGQAITFMTYEFVSKQLHTQDMFVTDAGR